MKMVLALLATTGLLAGCGEVGMVELSEEQAKQVAEYAANLVLKGAVNYDTRLVDTEAMISELAEERNKQAILDAKVEAMKPAEDSSGDEKEELGDSSDKPQVVDATKGESAAGSIEELMDTLTTTIVYDRYELVDSYPEDGSFVFAMDATEGCKLLVVHFQMTNVSGETVELDTALTGCHYRCSINGESYQSALSTLLLNDLSIYKGTLEAGQTEDVVLVWEVPEETEISSLELFIKKESGQIKMKLL